MPLHGGLLRGPFGWSNAECLQRTRLARMVAAYGDVGESMFEGGLPVAHAVEIARGFANPRSRPATSSSSSAPC